MFHKQCFLNHQCLPAVRMYLIKTILTVTNIHWSVTLYACFSRCDLQCQQNIYVALIEFVIQYFQSKLGENCLHVRVLINRAVLINKAVIHSRQSKIALQRLIKMYFIIRVCSDMYLNIKLEKKAGIFYQKFKLPVLLDTYLLLVHTFRYMYCLSDQVIKMIWSIKEEKIRCWIFLIFFCKFTDW